MPIIQFLDKNIKEGQKSYPESMSYEFHVKILYNRHCEWFSFGQKKAQVVDFIEEIGVNVDSKKVS